MADLSTFQIKCESELVAALARLGARLTERERGGQRETYVRARIEGTDLAIYIYSDEAQIQGSNVDLRFEAPDFASGDSLRATFIAKTCELAREAVA